MVVKAYQKPETADFVADGGVDAGRCEGYVFVVTGRLVVFGLLMRSTLCAFACRVLCLAGRLRLPERHI